SILDILFFFFLLTPPPPRSTLFPYTTLFRSKPHREVSGVRDLEQALGTCERLLRAHEALLDRSVRADEGAGNLVDAEAAQDVKRSEEHTSELQSLAYLVCRLLLEKKKKKITT